MSVKSQIIKKDIVSARAVETIDIIIKDINDTFFSILVDESQVISVKEQMLLFYIIFDKTRHVVERFIRIEHVFSTTALSLKAAIDKLFSRYGLSISRLRGQGYDGASNMQALVAITKKHKKVQTLFNLVSSMVNIVGASSKHCACLCPGDSFSAFDKDKLIRLAKYYPKDFSKGQFMTLDDQLRNHIVDMHSNKEFRELKGLSELALKLVETKRNKVYLLVYMLVTLGLTLPVATASVERVFSVINIVKNRLRNQIGDQWMNDSLVVYVEKEVFNEIDNKTIIRCFQSMRSHKEKL
ncbi:uncharacterized protein LOC111371748 [Olea europaea var. sylvestris]|uniref:uncharacterized protein LOC111371748 n=1 Tax=Olea europaea var. sylvestris TaxID=158386 RepID=UPI000C1D6D5F|nr:uncharacterized protein LOC111371748 [Olea europaea var. sylvestris]